MIVHNSRIARALSVGARRLRTAFNSATTTHRLRKVLARFVAVASNSWMAQYARGAKRAARSAWMYQWLTEEPEPDVVVIDLRETVVVGPIIAVLDSLVTALANNSDQSRTEQLLAYLNQSLIERPIQVFSVVVLAAVASNLALSLSLGDPSPTELGLRLILASLALAGTRIELSWDDLTDSHTYELLVSLLEPPEPPEPPEEE